MLRNKTCRSSNGTVVHVTRPVVKKRVLSLKTFIISLSPSSGSQTKICPIDDRGG